MPTNRHSEIKSLIKEIESKCVDTFQTWFAEDKLKYKEELNREKKL